MGKTSNSKKHELKFKQSFLGVVQKCIMIDVNAQYCPNFRRFSFEKLVFELKITADSESVSKTELDYVFPKFSRTLIFIDRFCRGLCISASIRLINFLYMRFNVKKIKVRENFRHTHSLTQFSTLIPNLL